MTRVVEWLGGPDDGQQMVVNHDGDLCEFMFTPDGVGHGGGEFVEVRAVVFPIRWFVSGRLAERGREKEVIDFYDLGRVP